MFKVEEYVRNLKGIFPFLQEDKGLPNPHLYHYTTPDALLDIIETKGKCGFCCTHYQFLNDDSEFACGIELVIRWIEEQIKRSRYDSSNFIVRVETLVADVRKAIQKECVPWVLSLTRGKDDVSQWMAYTDHVKGGYAIGVDYRALIKSVVSLDDLFEKILCNQEFETIWFVAPCVYVDKSEKCDLRYPYTDESRKTAFNCLDNILRKCGGIGLFKSKNAIQCLARLALMFATLVKNGEFKHEREWRVVALTDSTFSYDSVEFIGGKPRIRLPVKSAVDLIDKLVVSHHGNRERLKLMAELLKKTYESEKKFSIKKSATSYVG